MRHKARGTSSKKLVDQGGDEESVIRRALSYESEPEAVWPVDKRERGQGKEMKSAFYGTLLFIPTSGHLAP